MRALDARVGDVADWLAPRLFEPLGIEDPPWDRCPNGWITAGSGLHLTLEELARTGQLISDDGVWEGRRLVSSRWIQALHSEWFEREAGLGYTRYALAGWDGPGAAWRLHDAHRQMLMFVDDTVVTITADDHAGADRMVLRVLQAVES